jgi:glycosyltransferase involved in cell wall biosynthesis
MEKIKMNAKQTLGLDNGKPMLLFVGQHILEKNLRFLIKSLAACDIDYSAHFIGEGYAKKELEEMVKLFGLSHKITFWGVVRERELLKRFYAAADLFLFPSRYDNAPLVVREAAAMGTPSLLLENSTSAEVVENGINGYISEENIRTYAKQISDIVRNPNNLNIGINASKTICRSWEDITSETIDRYNFLMIKKSSKRFQHIIGLNS